MKAQKEIAAFVYRFDKKGRLRLWLVCNRQQSRWILPKGQPEKKRADAEVAIKEVYEEAGVEAEIDTRLPPKVVYYERGSRHGRGGGPVALHVYAARERKKLATWPEQDFRLRYRVDVNTALLMLGRAGLRAVTGEMAAAILALEKPR